MKISNLSDTSNQEIVDCLSISFEGYFVKMPTDVEFWNNRFTNSRVDKSLSWGVFENKKLIGFVLNAIDYEDEVLTAFNTGTGIIPSFRGQRLVDKMYENGLNILKQNGITRSNLEVICENKRAIKVYERIGFKLGNRLKCYKGILTNTNSVRIEITEIDDLYSKEYDKHYSWDNQLNTIKKACSSYNIYKVYQQNNLSGYFVINPGTGYLAQVEKKADALWHSIFDGIAQVKSIVKINNIPEFRTNLISYLESIEMQNTIDQYHMEMKL